MLSSLHDILEKNDLARYFSIKEASEFCNSKLEVIDFDFVKDEFSKTSKIKNKPKSADALLIDKQRNTITFIEFKDLNKIIENHDANFNQFFRKTDLSRKVLDSFFLLLAILDFYNLDTSKISFYTDNQNQTITNIRLKFIVLVNISSRNYLKHRIAQLANLKSHESGFLYSLNMMRADDFESFVKNSC